MGGGVLCGDSSQLAMEMSESNITDQTKWQKNVVSHS